MFNKSLLVKVILALMGFGAVTTMAFYGGLDDKWLNDFPGNVFQGGIFNPKPAETLEPDKPDISIGLAAPEITDQKLDNTCGTKVWWYDNEKNEDNVRFYRRIVGVSDFVLFKVTGPHAGGPGFFGEANLPNGTYEYRVSVVSELGEAFSDVSQPITVNSDFCNDNSIPNKPLNPVITSLERFSDNTCAIRINYQDNSLDEDGIRIYREVFPNSDLTVIAELPASDDPTGFYDDKFLPPGKYRYRVSVFNEGGETFSNYSTEFVIQDDVCKLYKLPVIALPTMGAADNSSASEQACMWTSSINVFVRKGPSSSLYSDITAVVAGTTLPVVGQSEDGQFWVVDVQPGVQGYVPKTEKFGRTTGDCNVPTLKDPAPPASNATEPPSVNEPEIPACRDGVDNDGDGYIDMRDRDCTDPNDTSES